jgi:hypothetical protein
MAVRERRLSPLFDSMIEKACAHRYGFCGWVKVYLTDAERLWGRLIVS